MNALDLTERPPRSPYEELDGLLFMPRTIDKLRATLPGGKTGEYFISSKIRGMSAFLLDFLGVKEDELRHVVAEADDDAAVAAWLSERVDRSRYPEFNLRLRHAEIRHADDPDYMRELYAPTLQAHPELVRLLDILEADDRRMFSRGVTSR